MFKGLVLFLYLICNYVGVLFKHTLTISLYTLRNEKQQMFAQTEKQQQQQNLNFFTIFLTYV